MKELTVNHWYKVSLKANMRFTGQLTAKKSRTCMMRIGLDDKLIFGTDEIKSIVEVSGRDIETRQNGRYYVI